VLLRNPPTSTSGSSNNTHTNTNTDTDFDTDDDDGYVLPLTPGYAAGELVLVGPHVRTQVELAGNYFEDIGLGNCVGPACIPSLETAFNTANQNSQRGTPVGNATVVQACPDRKCAVADTAAVTAAVGAAGVKAVVLCMGIDGTIEGEGNDRMDIRLPGQQGAVIQAALDAAAPGVKVVLLLFNGGMVTIEDFNVAPHLAVVECWYPGATGGTSVAETVFGFPGSNRFGKLPFTYVAVLY
jgi:hypothetical protein